MTADTSPTSKATYPRSDNVDVLFLLEGTFPFVAGGVSSWVNQIIRGFPEIRFGAIFLGSRAQDYGDLRYALPDKRRCLLSMQMPAAEIKEGFI